MQITLFREIYRRDLLHCIVLMALILRAYNVIFWVALLLVGRHTGRVKAEPTQDKQALLAFLSHTPHANRIQWNTSDSVCNWVGVGCDHNGTFVIKLRLPGAGIVGAIPHNTIGRLSQLRVLSFRYNRISGKIPSDFANLTLLRSLYLQNNELTGKFPVSLTSLSRLVRLDLSSNNFTGSIPLSINNLTHLTALLLENNAFSGELPNISAQLYKFNASNNHLNGSIPETLTKFPASSFAGNLNLCGEPLPPCNSFPAPAPSPSGISLPTPLLKKSKKLSKLAILLIAVGCFLLLLLLIPLLFLFERKRRRQQHGRSPNPVMATPAASSGEAGPSSSKDVIVGGSGESEKNDLTFFGGWIHSFELEDLLRASAEVLGKGTVGITYKALVEEGTTAVVKRLKDVALTKREFDTQMELLGKIKHNNVVELRAFYFSKDEKLLVYDYMSSGSMSALLHGNRGSGQPPLDWDNRTRIALSAARGLSHLHVSGVVHGNIKSSNILLKSNHEACLSDFGLNPLFGTSTSPEQVAGFWAPEVMETRKVTFKSDVYSFGVLLLELLTGKAPNQTSFGEEGIDLPRWVQFVLHEERTTEVFDVELMRYRNDEEELIQLLQIAMACVSVVPDKRPDMRQVLRMIQDMNRGENEIADYGLQHSSDD